MKTFDFHYSVREVDGKEFELIECTTGLALMYKCYTPRPNASKQT